MPSPYCKSRPKKLLKMLLESQQHDLEITAPLSLEAKFHLRWSRLCSIVEVKENPHSTISLPAERAIFPRFIVSQLEAQKLANEEDAQIALTPLLHFILTRLSRELTDDWFATSFHWQSPKSHRTYYLFAYLDCVMPSRTYSIQELLSLRARDLSADFAALVEKDEMDEDLAEVFAHAPSRNRLPNQSLESAPVSGHTVDDTSAESDELLFKGHLFRRVAMTDTKADAKMDSTANVAVANEPDASTEMEWKYRGRSDSEAAATEPLSAPTGINAQQSEGFQRFYKAVVSPTHVRVTAGGRIVPNTRGPGSPTSKRAREKEPADEKSIMEDVQARPTNASADKNHPQPMLAVPPHFYPPYPHSHHPQMSSHLPMMPMPMGFNYAFAPPSSADNASAKPSTEPLKGSQKKENDMGQATVRGLETEKSENKIKISPPEQFDHTKPFLYNGQVVYPFANPFPPPMGFQPLVPPGYVGAQPFPMYPGHLMGPHGGPNVMPPPPGFSRPPGLIPHFPGMPAGFTGPVQPAKSPAAPPISSIRPSDISKRQAESLRHALKYHEDQLQYNRHQIDEKEMEKTIKMLKGQIEHFDQLRHNQLLYEDKYYPKREKLNEEPTPTFPQHSAPPKSPFLDKNIAQPHRHAQAGPQRSRESLRGGSGINSSQSNEAAVHFGNSNLQSHTGAQDKKPSLPYDAALAPPFRPRQSTSDKLGLGAEAEAEAAYYNSQREAAEKRLLASGAQAWKSAQRAPCEKSLRIGTGDQPARDHQPREESHSGQPYLVALAPSNVSVSGAHGTAYSYERELTEDELTARMLYWSNLPHSHGLPKFDGKHFYPPSPVNHTSTSAGSSMSLQGRGHVSKHNSFSGQTHDPFRPSTPTPASGAMAGATLFTKENTPPRQEEARRDRRGLPRTERASDTDAMFTGSSGRKLGENTGARILHNVLKRGSTKSHDALPGTVSSATAQGFLPPNSRASSALSPVVSSGSNHQDGSGYLSSDGEVILDFVAQRAKLNRRHATDAGPATLEDQFRNIVAVDKKNRSGLPQHFEGA